MCDFVTATLDPRADVERVREVFESHGRALTPLAGSPIAAALGAAGRYFLTLGGGACDCGTPLGAARLKDRGDVTKELEKRRRQGWSAAKLARWLEQRTKAVPPPQSEQLDRWRQLVTSAVEVGGARTVGLSLHTYRGRVDTEDFPVARERLPIQACTLEFLADMRRDTLYEFTAPQQRS